MTAFLKVIIVGDKGVGKRTLTSYSGSDARTSSFYIRNSYSNFLILAQDVVDLKVRATSGKNYNVIIHDSLILEDMIVVKDSNLIQNSLFTAMSDAHAVLFCYDMNDPHTLMSLAEWYRCLGVYLTSSTSIFLVGTKSDLEVRVTKKDLEQVEQRVKFVEMFEISSKKAGASRNMFISVVDTIEQNLKNRSLNSSRIRVNLKSKEVDLLNGESKTIVNQLFSEKKFYDNNLKLKAGDDSPNLQSFEGFP